jgi:predicted transcriptional regulator
MSDQDYTCLCGKKGVYDKKQKAEDALDRIFAQGGKGLSGVVKCHLQPGIWHLTSKIGNNHHRFSALERELHVVMSVATDFVTDYIKKKYERSRGTEYKCSSREIMRAATESSKPLTSNNVSTAVYKLKKSGILTELDELDKSGKGGRPSPLFTLTSILDEITNPKNEGETKEMAKDNNESKVPAQGKTPLTVAANPFDKVNERLELILTQLTGLANGYSELAKRPSGGSVDAVANLLERLTNTLAQEESASLNAIQDIKTLIQREASTVRVALANTGNRSADVSIPADAVAEAVNQRLGDLRKDDAFIYRVREELDDAGGKTDKHITAQFNRVDNKLQILFEAWKKDQHALADMIKNISVPSSVANADDYRAGIKEGIRLAAEMGLKVTGE